MKRLRLALAASAVILVLAGSCAPPEPDTAPVPVAVPETLDPGIRIGILVNVARATVGSSSGMRIADPDEGTLRDLAASSVLDATTSGADVAVLDAGERVARPVLIITPTDSGAALRINGRDYHGTVELRRTATGLTVINRVSLEQYLAGVVGAEMGPRTASEIEALKAQAVVSRTYAIRNQGRWRDQGYDLVGTVNDQVYGGILADNSLAVAAVRATRGEVLAFGGQPIDAFFFSTCGGRTEDGVAAFAGAERPYLRALDDVDPSGKAWCASSPRYRWTAGWTAAELAATLRRTLGAERLPPARATDLRDVRVVEHTPSGRVAAIELTGSNGRTAVIGQAIRRVLSPSDGGLLRSTEFTIRVSRTGGRIERIDIDGRGNGHGVGMCQWGAIGRARAGQDYRTIVASYFPGTDIERLY